MIAYYLEAELRLVLRLCHSSLIVLPGDLGVDQRYQYYTEGLRLYNDSFQLGILSENLMWQQAIEESFAHTMGRDRKDGLLKRSLYRGIHKVFLREEFLG